MSELFTHKPVLAEETANLLVTDRKGIYVDATVGFGGHCLKILSMLDIEGKVIGIDWDPEMINLARKNLNSYQNRAMVFEGNFANIDEIIAREDFSEISGVLFDLGVSSLHFDKPSRGFSIKLDGPLDMRINPANPLTAHTIINKWPYEQIEHLIRICGERHSVRIAREIVETRRTSSIETTSELRKLIEKIVPPVTRIHPATKTFLALRVAVNYEFDNLTRGIQKASQFLGRGARMAIITFHSLEDRIVKETFKLMCKIGGWNLVIKKPVKPSVEEIQNNPRARSAKLRVIEKEV